MVKSKDEAMMMMMCGPTKSIWFWSSRARSTVDYLAFCIVTSISGILLIAISVIVVAMMMSIFTPLPLARRCDLASMEDVEFPIFARAS